MDIFLDQLPLSNTEWSVRGLLSFSYIPAISTALEGDTRIELFDTRENDQMDDNSNTHHPDDDCDDISENLAPSSGQSGA